MSMIFKLGLAAAVLGLSCVGRAAAPMENYLGSTVGAISVSPSGQAVGMIRYESTDQPILAIASFIDGKMGQPHGISIGALRPVDILFKSEDRLIVTVVQRDVEVSNAYDTDGDRYRFHRTIVISMAKDGSDARPLMPEATFGASVQASLPNDPTHVLLAVSGDSRYVADLYRVDIMTGETEVVERGRFVEKNDMGTRLGPQSLRTFDWSTDINGTPFMRFDMDRAHNEILVYARPIGSSQWHSFATYPMIEGPPEMGFAGLASHGSVYVTNRSNGDMRGVWEYDLETGKPIRQIMSEPDGEAVDLLVNDYKGELTGAVFYRSGQLKTVYLSKTLAAAQAALDESYPQFPVKKIVSYARNLGVLAIRAEGPSQQPVYMLFDVRRMEAVGVSGPSVPAEALGKTRTLQYVSADGRSISAFLTLPPGGGQGLPLVVMPHGGPRSYDALDYDGWRQALASRGYAVLQPQFRGSDGFGAAFERAGDGTWGTSVQDDVRAGVAEVVKQGLADPDRVCIFGWSYGGYLALSGAALSPDLYKCAISGAGPGDLAAMMQSDIKRFGAKSSVVAY